MEPERLGRFEIEELRGQGGMGSVYAARDVDTGERVALKVLSSSLLEDEEKFLRFEQEVAALSRIEHENIVRLLGPIERDEHRVFFPMELLSGGTLSQRLRKDGPMPVPPALGIIRSVLSGLGAAHDAGVVHRDVKPSNIVLEDGAVKITDFGLARMDDLTRLTQTGQIMGTLDYMSPEQCNGAVADVRSDLYSAGIVLYEMLAGAPPFRRETAGAVLKGHLTDAPTPLSSIRSDLPEGLPEVVDRLLLKDPASRYGSAEELLGALEGMDGVADTVTFHRGRSAGMIEPETVRDLPDEEPATVIPVRGHRLLLVAVVVLATLLVAGVGFLLLSGPNGREPAGNGSGPPDLRSGDPPVPPPPVSPTEVLEHVHAALRDRDFAGFMSCFLDGALDDRLTGDAAREFSRRVADLSDFEFKARLPMMGAGTADQSVRMVQSPALSAVLGFAPGRPLRIVFRQAREGSLISTVESSMSPRRGPPGGNGGREGRNIERMARGVFEKIGEHAPEFMDRLVEQKLLTRERADAALRRLREATARGPLDFEVLEEGSRLDPRRAEITVRSRGLAKVLGVEEDRFVIVFTRSMRDRKMRFRGIRLAGS